MCNCNAHVISLEIGSIYLYQLWLQYRRKWMRKRGWFFFIILSQHTKQYEKLKLNFLGSKTTTWDGKNKNFHKKGKLKIKEKQK